jgi:hypothetical protein
MSTTTAAALLSPAPTSVETAGTPSVGTPAVLQTPLLDASAQVTTATPSLRRAGALDSGRDVKKPKMAPPIRSPAGTNGSALSRCPSSPRKIPL